MEHRTQQADAAESGNLNRSCLRVVSVGFSASRQVKTHIKYVKVPVPSPPKIIVRHHEVTRTQHAANRQTSAEIGMARGRMGVEEDNMEHSIYKRIKVYQHHPKGGFSTPPLTVYFPFDNHPQRVVISCNTVLVLQERRRGFLTSHEPMEAACLNH